MRVVRVFATAVVFVLCLLCGAFVGVVLRSQAALLSGTLVGLLVGAALAHQVWQMPVSHTAISHTAGRRTPAKRVRKRRR